MHRTDAPGFAPGNVFTEGDPQLGVPFSHVSADWLNDVQENLCQAIEGSGLNLSKGNYGQLLEAIRLLYGSGGRRNRLINGGFLLNQRGSSHVFTNGTPRYTLDRWLFSPGSGNTTSVTISQGGGATPSFSTGFRHSWALGWAQTAALNGSTHPVLSQRIENVLLFAGRKCCLSVWMTKSGAAGGVEMTITPKLVQFKGTGQGVFATTVGAPVTVSDSGYVRHVWTFDVPAMGSQALANDAYFELQLEGLKTATRGVGFAGIQLEAGNSPTEFEDRTDQDELLLAQRYYEKSYEVATAPGTPTLLGQAADRALGFFSYGLNTRFRVEKARIPTVRWYAPNTGTADAITWGGAAGSDLTASPTEESMSSTGHPGHTNQTTAAESWGHWTADAEI
jgi:hypothetical protein